MPRYGRRFEARKRNLEWNSRHTFRTDRRSSAARRLRHFRCRYLNPVDESVLNVSYFQPILVLKRINGNVELKQRFGSQGIFKCIRDRYIQMAGTIFHLDVPGKRLNAGVFKGEELIS